MSLSACIRSCPATTRSPWLLYWLRPQVGGEHGRLGFLGLQEQRFGSVSALHQGDPRAGADAADPDYLAGQLDQGEVPDQVPAVGLQGALVLAQHLTDQLVDLLCLHIGEELLDRLDQRRVADDAPLPVDLGGELAQRFHAVLGARLGHHLLGGLDSLGLELRPELADGVIDVQVRVPHVHEGLPRERAHGRPVALGRREHDLAAVLPAEPVVPAGHGQARRQPLDIPLERAGQRLVEVVDIEDQPPRRRGKRPEVGQVRVTAQLHPQPGRGRGGQVGRHRQGRAPVVGERRHEHPPVPDRHQLRHPALRLLQQQADRIPRLIRRELRVRLQRGQAHGILPPGHPVRMGRLFPGPGPLPHGPLGLNAHDSPFRLQPRHHGFSPRAFTARS
jgi:hypothetical protein